MGEQSWGWSLSPGDRQGTATVGPRHRPTPRCEGAQRSYLCLISPNRRERKICLLKKVKAGVDSLEANDLTLRSLSHPTQGPAPNYVFIMQ